MGVGFGNMRSDLPQRPNPKKKSGEGNNGWRDRTIIPPQGNLGRLSPEKIRDAVRAVQGTSKAEAANPPTETYEDAFQSWYAQGGSWPATTQTIDYRSAIDAAVQELRAKHQNEPTNTNELLAAEKVVVGALLVVAQNVTLGIKSLQQKPLKPQFVVAQREKLKNLPVIEGDVGSEVRQDLLGAFQKLQQELRNAR